LPRQSIYRSLSRYFVVVLSGFFLDFLIYAAIVALGHSVYLANVAGFCAGTLLNVLLIRRFVFSDNRFDLSADVALTFATNGTMLLVGTGILWLLVEAAFVNVYLAKLLANAATFLLNYMTRHFVFRKE
jgi:putative flippase GtrA